jgi:uncharacterized protein (DUF1330 family)
MAAYVLVNVEVNDPEAYREYTAQTPGTVEQYGGRFIVRGGAAEVIEGSFTPKRVVVIEFPSLEQAKAWYHSPEYQAILPLRLQHASTEFLVMVEGV